MNRKDLLSFSILVGIASIAATPVFAQTAQAGQSAEPAPETVVVTGSRIAGAKAAGDLPVSVLTQERIAAVGSISGDDLFRSIPQAGDVQFQESRTTGNLNDARGDNSSINLRNVGTGNTLVLLNGRRMILTPGTQTENFVPVQTANTNSLPVGAISRIEVLRDGAAAIYGADAVAGVINVVLDKKFKGLRTDYRLSLSDGTDEATLAAKYGIETKSGGNFMLFGSYTQRSRLMASERDFSASENHMPDLMGTPWENDTSFDNRSTSSPWGSFTVLPTTTAVRQGTIALTTSGVFHIEPTSNTAAGCSSAVFANNLCIRSGVITGANSRVLRYDENPDRSIRGGLKRANLFSTYSRQIGDMEFFAEAGYYHAELSGQREQSAPLASAVITIPETNFYNPFGATIINGVANPNRLPNLVNVPTTGLAMRITTYRPVDTGPRVFTVTDDMFRGLAGLRGNWNGFEWESALSYSWARTDDHTKNVISNTLFQRALARSTPDAYNPFNGGNQANNSIGDGTPNPKDVIDSFLVGAHRIGTSSLTTGDFKFSKANLFALPAGDVGFAGGVEVRHETFEDNRDARLDGTITYTDMVSGIKYDTDIMGASGAPDVKADRTVAALFAELSVPVVSPEMSLPLVREIDLQLAVRGENYSDFGDVLKPKVAASWSIVKGVKLRSSWSESYRAPNLAQFYSAGTQVTNTRTDFAQCRINNTTCAGASTLEIRSGNQNLKSEDAETLSYGLVLTPIKNFVITIDKWKLEQDGVIGIEGAQNQILFDYLLRQTGGSNPNVVRLAPVGTQIVGNLANVQDNYFNLGLRTLEGIDYGISYDIRNTPMGNFSIDLSAAKLTKFQQSPSAMQRTLIEANAAGRLGTGITIAQAGSQIQQNGNPEWRGSFNLTWRKGNFSAGTLVNYVGPVFDTGTALVNGQFYQLEEMTTIGAWAQYRKDGVRGRFGVRNLTDEKPPLASNNFGFLGSLHSALGKTVYIELSKDF